jgi:PadR family transcriptional regulator PadR
MTRTRKPSPQSVRLVLTMGSQPNVWRHGYDLGGEAGLKSGSLYPILMRLKERGYLEAQWEQDPPPGRPARHLYRLTPLGRSLAAELLVVSAKRPARLVLGEA